MPIVTGVYVRDTAEIFDHIALDEEAVAELESWVGRMESGQLPLDQLLSAYERSARLLEDMEKAGLVSAMSTNGQRDILVPSRAE